MNYKSLQKWKSVFEEELNKNRLKFTVELPEKANLLLLGSELIHGSYELFNGCRLFFRSRNNRIWCIEVLDVISGFEHVEDKVTIFKGFNGGAVIFSCSTKSDNLQINKPFERGNEEALRPFLCRIVDRVKEAAKELHNDYNNSVFDSLSERLLNLKVEKVIKQGNQTKVQMSDGTLLDASELLSKMKVDAEEIIFRGMSNKIE